MAKSSASQHTADLLPRYRLLLQGIGLALAGAGFGGLWWLAPANLAAQHSSILGLRHAGSGQYRQGKTNLHEQNATKLL